MIQIKNIDFYYPNSNTKTLDNISLTIEKGGIYAIIGHTGSGKSTLIRHFNGLLSPDSGTALINGVEITKSNAKTVRKSVGLVFQYPEHQLFAETVFDDIAFGPRNLGMSENEVEQSVKRAMELVSLPESLRAKSPFCISGGERRRTALAGVLAMKPQILVLDEPSAGLDPGSRCEIQNIIMDLHKSNPKNTIVFVSHSMDEAACLADRIFVIDSGKIILEGTPEEVFCSSELLAETGLGIPSAAELTIELRRRGIMMKNVYTIKDAASEILRLCKK